MPAMMSNCESALPGPFLELSTVNLHLDEMSVDQLAALWNVFTKVGDSLHKGRRLENLTWRAWHREAHLLPPDASIADFADCTPLETPAISRTGSISYPRKPSLPQSMATYWSNHPDNLPSDPESGAEWSDDDRSDEELPLQGSKAAAGSSKPSQGDGQTRSATSGPAPAERGRKAGPSQSNLPTLEIDSSLRQVQQQELQHDRAAASSSKQTLTSPMSQEGDRKRAASSSAFGSRARVRHLNLRKASRRRPISFQAALESLAAGNDSDDLAKLAREHSKRHLGPAHERRSFQGSVPLDVIVRANEQDDAAVLAASHSSAPATSGFDEGRLLANVGIEAESVQPPEQQTATTIPPISPAQTRASPEPSKAASQQPAQGQSASPAPQPARPSSMEAMPPPQLPASRKPSASTTEAINDNQAVTRNVAVPANSKGTAPAEAKSSKGKKAKFFLSSSMGKSYPDEEDEVMPPPPTTTAAAPARDGPTQETESTQSQAQPHPEVSAGPKASKSKTDVKHHGGTAMTSAHRSRSGASLAKAKGKKGSSTRLAPGGLMMTKAQPALQAVPPSATTKQPVKSTMAGKKGAKASKPVKFTMGDDEEDDDGFSDEEPEVKPAKAAAPAPAAEPPKATAPASETVVEAGNDDEDEDGWSSDTSAEAEEEKQRQAALLRQRKKAEEERQQELFKKIPIRSASTADLQRPEPTRPTTPQAGQQPTRGLLSSLFHPDEEPPHPPPGQLHGRPHASAADLRTKPERPASRASDKKQHRPPSLMGMSQPGEAGGPLKTVKSAVALPVLNTASSLVTATDSDAEDDLQDDTQYRRRSSNATRPEAKRLSSGSVVDSPDSAQTVRSRNSREASRSRERPSAGPEPLAAPTAPHRAPLPAPSAAQTPRTTRRNMLRDELSESLRQNLLWERQSRNRMLGIGANGPRPATTAPPEADTPVVVPAHRPARRETVLGGNQLRPLTQGTATNPPLARAPTTSASSTALAGQGEQRHGSASGTHLTSHPQHHHQPLLHHPAPQHHHHHHHHHQQQPQQHRQQQQHPPPYMSNHPHSRSTPHLAQAHGYAPELPRRQTGGPDSRDSRSADTTSDEEGGPGGDDDHHTSSRRQSGGSSGTAGGRKKVMYPGGWMDFHTQGW